MDQDNNLSVRNAVDHFEKSFTEDDNEQSSFSIPGYLRSTTSAKNKLNPKPDSFSVVSRETKRPRFSTQPPPPPPPPQAKYETRPRPHSRQESRESSVFSISSITTTASSAAVSNIPSETTKSDEDMILIAKCVQYEFLYNESKRHFENLKRNAEKELAMAEAALKMKQKEDQLTLKELIKDDPTDIFHHILCANELVERIQEKINRKDMDFTKEKQEIKELLLEELNDLKIPAEPGDFDINSFVECRELLQSLLDYN